MLRRFIVVGITAIFLLSASAYADPNKTIYIEIVGEGRFEVIYHRALSNAIGAAIGGVIGAGIQSGVEANKDGDKVKELSPLIKKDAWKSQFLDTLNDKLEAQGFEAVWVEDTPGVGEGIVLKIYPESYGYRIVDTTTRMVSAYIEFKAGFSGENLKNAQDKEKESYYITHKNQYPYEKLLEKDSPVNSDLEAVLEKAASRLANKIIYSLKE